MHSYGIRSSVSSTGTLSFGVLSRPFGVADSAHAAGDVVLYVCLFFFQAEDGIRDGRVTGVQTCALPIWAAGHDLVPRRRAALPLAGQPLVPSVPRRSAGAVRFGGHRRGRPRAGGAGQAAGRSEERRVGKECRWRWAAGRSKKINVKVSYR